MRVVQWYYRYVKSQRLHIRSALSWTKLPVLLYFLPSIPRLLVAMSTYVWLENVMHDCHKQYRLQRVYRLDRSENEKNQVVTDAWCMENGCVG